MNPSEYIRQRAEDLAYASDPIPLMSIAELLDPAREDEYRERLAAWRKRHPDFGATNDPHDHL